MACSATSALLQVSIRLEFLAGTLEKKIGLLTLQGCMGFGPWLCFSIAARNLLGYCAVVYSAVQSLVCLSPVFGLLCFVSVEGACDSICMMYTLD